MPKFKRDFYQVINKQFFRIFQKSHATTSPLNTPAINSTHFSTCQRVCLCDHNCEHSNIAHGWSRTSNRQCTVRVNTLLYTCFILR